MLLNKTTQYCPPVTQALQLRSLKTGYANRVDLVGIDVMGVDLEGS